VQLGQQVLDVGRDRPAGDEELFGDLGVGGTVHDEAQDLDLPAAETERLTPPPSIRFTSDERTQVAQAQPLHGGQSLGEEVQVERADLITVRAEQRQRRTLAVAGRRQNVGDGGCRDEVGNVAPQQDLRHRQLRPAVERRHHEVLDRGDHVCRVAVRVHHAMSSRPRLHVRHGAAGDAHEPLELPDSDLDRSIRC